MSVASEFEHAERVVEAVALERARRELANDAL
jgi:hypothetical protein